MDQVTTPRPGLRSQVWQFARHYLEMCVAMCVGGGILTALPFLAGPALLGYPDLREQAPELALVVIAFILALPMAVWMRFRGMAWRPTLEMSGATIGLAIVLVGLAGLGVVPDSSIREWVTGAPAPSFCGPACAVMFVVMLFRLGLYTGRTGHHMGHGTHRAPRGLRPAVEPDPLAPAPARWRPGRQALMDLGPGPTQPVTSSRSPRPAAADPKGLVDLWMNRPARPADVGHGRRKR